MLVKRRGEQNSERVDSMVLNHWILEESNDIRYVLVLRGDRQCGFPVDIPEPRVGSALEQQSDDLRFHNTPCRRNHQ